MLNGWLVASSVALLFVGNSYTARNQLADRVADRAENSPTLEQAWVASVTIGGARWADHTDRLADPESALRRASQERAWDTWVLQEQSQVLGFPEGQPEREASLTAALELAEEASQIGAQTHLFLTWGRRLGDARNPSLYPDYLTMQDLLTEGYLRTASTLAEVGYAVGIAPVGEAFRQVYLDDVANGDDPEAASARFSRLYSKDGSHPSVYGTLLASAVMEASLLGRLHALENSDVAADDEQFVAYLDEVTRTVVLNRPFGAYAYPWATRWDGGDSVEVMGVTQRPALAFESEAALSKMEVGGSVDGSVADGEVWVQASASVTTSQLALGSGGDNALVVNGGSLVADQWVFGDGRVALRGGQFSVTRTQEGAGQPSFDWSDGTFEVLGDVELNAKLEQPQSGTLRIGQGARLGLDEGDFRGLIHVVSLDGEEADVLVANRLSIDGASVEVPEGYSWSIATVGDAQALRVTRGEQPPVTDVPVSDGCGCNAHMGSTVGAWSFALLLCWARRARD